MNRPPYQKDAGIAQLFGKAQALYREIGKELLDVPLTGGGGHGNFTAALGIPTLDGLGADGKGAHAAYEQIYFSSLMPRTYLRAALGDAGLTVVICHAVQYLRHAPLLRQAVCGVAQSEIPPDPIERV